MALTLAARRADAALVQRVTKLNWQKAEEVRSLVTDLMKSAPRGRGVDEMMAGLFQLDATAPEVLFAGPSGELNRQRLRESDVAVTQALRDLSTSPGERLEALLVKTQVLTSPSFLMRRTYGAESNPIARGHFL